MIKKRSNLREACCIVEHFERSYDRVDKQKSKEVAFLGDPPAPPLQIELASQWHALLLVCVMVGLPLSLLLPCWARP